MILMLFETKFQDQNCCTFDLEFIFQILDKRLKGILLHHLDFFSSSLLPQVNFSQSFAFTFFSLSSTCFALTLHVGCLSSFSNSFPTVKLDQMIIPWILNYCSGKKTELTFQFQKDDETFKYRHQKFIQLLYLSLVKK